MTTRRQVMLHHGGLMRCCVESHRRWVEADPQAEVQPGERIECVYEHKPTMVVDEHCAWVRWDEGKGP